MALGASLGVVGLGILLRVCGFSMGLHEFMSWRPEFVTPLTSFNRRESTKTTERLVCRWLTILFPRALAGIALPQP